MFKPTLFYSAQADLGECPRWHDNQQALYYVDIAKCLLCFYQPSTQIYKERKFAQEIGSFVFDDKGGFILAMRHGFYSLKSFDDEPIFLCDPETDQPLNRFNDGRCDALGRFWAGTMMGEKTSQNAHLYCLDHKFNAIRKNGHVFTSNGIAFSPDNKILYYADTPNHVIYAYDFNLATASISNKRVFKQFEHGKGRPDGATIDIVGNYWVALYAGYKVICINPQGDVIHEVPIEAENCTMVGFGGDDYKTAFVTTARQKLDETNLKKYPHSGDIFTFRVEIPALKENKFLSNSL